MAHSSPPLSSSSSSLNTTELNTPVDELTMEPSTLITKNITITDIIQYHKCSIHHQDAEASIADTTDCLRMITGKIEWFQRKHQFCPHLFTKDDAKQILVLHQRLLIEEIPFLELQGRVRDGLYIDVPRELQGRIASVCQKFQQLKSRFDSMLTNINNSSQLQSPLSPLSPTQATTPINSNNEVIEV